MSFLPPASETYLTIVSAFCLFLPSLVLFNFGGLPLTRKTTWSVLLALVGASFGYYGLGNSATDESLMPLLIGLGAMVIGAVLGHLTRFHVEDKTAAR